MKIEETYDFWRQYIENHPGREYISDRYDMHYTSYGEAAPHLSGWVAHFPWNTIVFSKYSFDDMRNRNNTDSWHRLDGPAYIALREGNTSAYFYLHGVRYAEDEWKKMPDVINVLVDKCFHDIMHEDE